MFDYKLEHVCSYTATLQSPPEVIGPVPEGLRLNVYVTGGEVTGPKLRGRIRPVGADWLTIRRDGIGLLDVRATMETHDGALIYVAYNGIGDLGQDGYEKALRGEFPARMQLRTAPRFTCSHPDYTWVNRFQYVNVGEVSFETFVVEYDVYALR
ncbi:MAG: DUF3237 domain-containing protein [Gammaproteobacteria bacterium]|nr:DUF3237 domain-containing protein [Gammaproteobacteria bacterium]